MLEPALAELVEQEFRRIGFDSVTLDPKGYRSGSLNEGVIAPSKP